MAGSNTRQRFVCTECKHTEVGSPRDDERYGCSKCGGQLRPIRYGYQKRKRRV